MKAPSKVHINALISKGVNKDILQYYQKFQSCMYCLERWSDRQIQPCLLNCGHLMCQECFKRLKKCVLFLSCTDTSPKIISKIKFDEDYTLKPSTILKFFVRSPQPHPYKYKQLPALTKISQLFKQQNLDYIHQVVSQIRVQSLLAKYKDIKDKTFIDIQNILKIKQSQINQKNECTRIIQVFRSARCMGD